MAWPSIEFRQFYDKKFKNPTTEYEFEVTRLINSLKSCNGIVPKRHYFKALRFFADVEDVHNEIAIRVHNRRNEEIFLALNENGDPSYDYLDKNGDPSYEYIIDIPNLIDSTPSITKHNMLILKPVTRANFRFIKGKVIDIFPEYIVINIQTSHRGIRMLNTNLRYDVEFICNRTPVRMEKKAIKLMESNKLLPFVFPRGFHRPPSVPIRTNFDWCTNSVAQNVAQQTVIKNIFNGTSYPYPYIVFGPPGTGKTTALFESIVQLWKLQPDSRILIVAGTNFACNIMAKRLLEFLPEDVAFRLFARSQEDQIDKIDPVIVRGSNVKINPNLKNPCEKSNFKDKKYEIEMPTLDELYQYRIIITTLITSGRLVELGFDRNHFTHLFIDECGSSTEASSLIPIAGLVSSNNTINANIILAGDPLQLGPVVHSRIVQNLGYSTSLIERLMEFPMYKQDAFTDEYNNRYITKLRLNYRSHRDIIHISNKLFYNSELVSQGSRDVTDWAINWRGLPNPKFPINFVAVFGQALRDDDSPSLYNIKEMAVVLKHLKELIKRNINGRIIRQTDIAVITPYRKQSRKIRELCDKCNWTDVEVASVEAFQGSEKSVVILSTVRSNVQSLGFLSNKKRFNVALTRAQGLLIIIGDPKLLMQGRCWYELIHFCYRNNALSGEPFSFFYK